MIGLVNHTRIKQFSETAAMVVLGFWLFFVPVALASDDGGGVCALLSSADGAMLASPDGNPVFRWRGQQKQIPASTLKILTSLVAIHYLGEDYRFKTDFFVDGENTLYIKGYGDPLLISEEIAAMARAVSLKTGQIKDLVLDDTFFEKPIVLPGAAEHSLQPYDAPNGALCANFNTVNFTTKGTAIISAEPQTPLVPLGREKIRAAKTNAGRILLTHDSNDITLYAGQLFQHFLKACGITITGRIRIGGVDTKNPSIHRIYRHESPYPLTEVIRRLLKYSNNFMANQLLLAAGAAAFGPPATLDKAVDAANQYISGRFDRKAISIVEGSGLSRNNQVTPAVFIDILMAFRPWHRLMTHKAHLYYKTGTLNGISTRAGYVADGSGGLYPFVVLVNTPGKTADPVAAAFQQMVEAR